jgi:hypothetical protein
MDRNGRVDCCVLWNGRGVWRGGRSWHGQRHSSRVRCAVLTHRHLRRETRGWGTRCLLARAVCHSLCDHGSCESSRADVYVGSCDYGCDGFLCAGTWGRSTIAAVYGRIDC